MDNLERVPAEELENPEPTPALHQVVMSWAIPLESVTGAKIVHSIPAEEIPVVSTIKEILEAIRQDCPKLVIRPSSRLKRNILFIAILVLPVLLTMVGVSRNYNIEMCPKIVIGDVEISNCIIMTKSNE